MIHALTATSFLDSASYTLVMSDEFNTPGRSFSDGGDPTWTALDRHDDDISASGEGPLHFYNSSMVGTGGGWLNVSTGRGRTEWTEFDSVEQVYKTKKKDFKSGMVNSWNKFCFTGGIVEISAVMPGSPTTAGLWPAMWLLGNLGRATYEASTNKIWPWSFDECDRELQHAQEISACNSNGHWGLIPGRGRGATEIDILEIMPGAPGPLPSTEPPIERPYGAMTLQVAPGVPGNRPKSGAPPLPGNDGHNGFAPSPPQDWYEHLNYMGNTSINPFFYGTYLAETKPGEPVHRSKLEAFQADAVGAIHQLRAVHFQKAHKYRLEWQPGNGGRIDWFVEDTQPDARGRGEHEHDFTAAPTPAPKEEEDSESEDGDGGDGKKKKKKKKEDKHATPAPTPAPSPPPRVDTAATPPGWVHAFSIVDLSLKEATRAQIPDEPSYVIFNTAVSSTWGFPYDTPATCKKCYDCSDPACACALPPGFCDTLDAGKTSMLVDYVRVYQTDEHEKHVGQKHTLGCDPLDHPTREYIKGHEYLYMRSLPFIDKDPLKPIANGGGACSADSDCGITGSCSTLSKESFWSTSDARVCRCGDAGWTGPHCRSHAAGDDEPGAFDIVLNTSWFTSRIANLYLPLPVIVAFSVVAAVFAGAFVATLQKKRLSGGVYVGLTQAEMTPRYNLRGRP
ncbi:hypothetical protein TeGR_g9975 [Tetraparma gracilis]|uniref:GH16 domain-containing protein n=1 Tax=Tetraparma gracilis TaxID=2962635 RepID=A0ABQ6NEI0_9STRA|nr:hypothetical protein TeGR_g9975 [Tetraparma gracilis]